MDKAVKFQSKWLERCIRAYLELGAEEPITKEALSVIKYLYLTTTNSCEIAFGQGDLPKGFYFEDAGDEWEDCCVSNPGKYKTLEDFVKVIDWGYDRKILSLKQETMKAIEEEAYLREQKDEAAMRKFNMSVKHYHAKNEDFNSLEENEETCDWGILVPDDFAYLTHLEVIRLMDCETEIHSLAFLKDLPKLRVLELGEIRLETMQGIEKLLELEELCIWPEFYYCD